MSGAVIEVVGVPSSAGAHWPGQEKGPAALRAAGLVPALRSHGWQVVDYGDPATTRWQPVKEDGISNASVVVSVARQTAERVRGAIGAGHLPLVLGGDCSITVGVLAGLEETDPGLVYFDGGLDLGTPVRNPRGILDAMGLAHMLDDEDVYRPLARVGAHRPLLRLDGLLGFGVNSSADQSAEIDRRGIRTVTSDEVRRDGRAAAAQARALMEQRERTFVVHFDVDVIDFFDLPLADVPVHVNDHRGLPFRTAMECLDVFLGSPLLAGLVVTELNPDHGTPADVHRFALRLAESLAAALPRRTVPGAVLGGHVASG